MGVMNQFLFKYEKCFSEKVVKRNKIQRLFSQSFLLYSLFTYSQRATLQTSKVSHFTAFRLKVYKNEEKFETL